MGKLAKGKAKSRARPKVKAKSKAKAKPKARARAMLAPAIQRTDEPFELQCFIKDLFFVSKVRASKEKLKIRCASACTGTNSFGIVARRFTREMPAIEVADIFGSDSSKSAQTFVVQNSCAPEHLFDAT